MKLQKMLNRKVEGKEYSKWIIVLPQKEIADLGWKEGIELKTKIKKDRIILLPEKSA